MGLPFKPMLTGFSHLNTWEYIGLRKYLLLHYSHSPCRHIHHKEGAFLDGARSGREKGATSVDHLDE